MADIYALLDSKQDIAVLTGDLVGSSNLSPERRSAVHEAFRHLSEELRSRYGTTIPYDIDVFRGDSWQLLIARPELALRLALYIRSSLRSHLRSSSVDTRVTIGIGTIDFLPENGVSTGDGTAFRLSGQSIETLGRSFRMSFASDRKESASCLDTIVKLVDFAAIWWTWRQAHAVKGALIGQTQEEIGAEWPDDPITQQAVAQHLTRAGWHAVDTAVAFFEDALTDTCQDN